MNRARPLLVAAVILLLSGPAHADGTTIATWRPWCEETLRTVEHREPWTDGGRRCLNYMAGARDLAGGLSGSSPICYSDDTPNRTGLIEGFLRWTEDHPEHADKHVAYGVMRALMEYHRCR